MSNANERFEAIGDLYYRRFHRLRPGKSESPLSYRDSNDEENHAQFDGWRTSDVAFIDAIDRLIAREARIESLQQELEDAADMFCEIAKECAHCNDGDGATGKASDGSPCEECAPTREAERRARAAITD